MPEKVPQAEIARRWGVNRSRISQYKTAGMPVSSIEAAFDWLAVNYSDRAIKVQDAQAAVTTVTGAVEPPAMPSSIQETSGKGVAVVVARLTKAESVAWKMYDFAVSQNQIAKVAALAKNYQAAAAARMAAEKDLVEYQIKVRDLMPLPDALELIGKILAPIKSQLVALPYSTSARANPSDPDLAREAISLEVEKMKEQIITALKELESC